MSDNKITLTYRPIPFHGETRRWATETFTSERELCQRVAELANGPEDDFQVNGSWLTAGDIADRLALIERRREAVAVTLLAQLSGIYSDEERTVLDLSMAGHVFRDWRPYQQRHLLQQADQLIAAYEGAL